MHPVHVHHPQSLRAAHTAASIRLNFRHFFAPLTSRLTDNNKYFPLPPFTLVDIAKFSFFHSRSPGKTYFFFNKVDTNDTLNQTKQRFFTGILRYLTASCYEEHLFLLNLHSLFKKLYGLIKKKKKKLRFLSTRCHFYDRSNFCKILCYTLPRRFQFMNRKKFSTLNFSIFAGRCVLPEET